MVQLLLHPWGGHMQMMERTCSLIQSAGDFTLSLISGYLRFQCKNQNKTPKQKITFFFYIDMKKVCISQGKMSSGVVFIVKKLQKKPLSSFEGCVKSYIAGCAIFFISSLFPKQHCRVFAASIVVEL